MEQSQNNKKVVAIVGLIAIVIVIAVGVIATSGKESEKNDAAMTTGSSQSNETETSPQTATSETSTATYKDGTYKADGSYSNPGGVSDISLEVTIKDGVVTESTFTPEASDSESKNYQERFASGYKSQVVGKSIDSISLSRVSGSSLTSNGFNEAIDVIKQQAKA